MTEPVKYQLNQASAMEIEDHLSHCDSDFSPALSSRVVVKDYAKKIQSNATRFEAWSGDTLVGLVAIYCNDQISQAAYITSVSVLREKTGEGIAACLMKHCIEHVGSLGMKRISLEVASGNKSAISLYKKFNFIIENEDESMLSMNLYIKGGDDYGK